MNIGYSMLRAYCGFVLPKVDYVLITSFCMISAETRGRSVRRSGVTRSITELFGSKQFRFFLCGTTKGGMYHVSDQSRSPDIYL